MKFRKEEVAGLEWDNIDFENNTISVNKAVIYPIICKDKKYLVSGYILELGGITYYVECSLSANMALRYFIELLKNYDLVENFKIEIE